MAAVAVLGTACLGPTQFDPTGGAPVGNLEVIADAAGGIRVAGWALDPETSAPVRVKVGSEGVVHDVLADRSRPDVAALYPGRGSNHGFDYTYGPLSPGLHGICVWVDNTVGVGDDRLLGCENVEVSDGNPRGVLESVVTPAARRIAVSGWTFDPNTPAPSDVVVNIDGALAARVTADRQRPDVGAAFQRPNSGFLAEVPASPGTHQVCVAVFNTGPGHDRLLGCSTITVADSAEDRRPQGYLTSVVPTGPNSVTLTGVATDPDGAAGLRVLLEVDRGKPGATSTLLDVTGGTFTAHLSGLGPGMHTLCPTGLDVDGGFGVRGDNEFVCGSVVTGSIAVGTGGAALDPVWVAPPSGNPLRNMSRDAGVSVTLGDGSVMWFFGDTFETDAVGNVRYFKHNTAAWASAGTPVVTRDAVASGNQPYTFVQASHSCADPGYPNPALWPESAVSVPLGSTTERVLVFMSKVCLGSGDLAIKPMGMALVELTYDRTAPPVDQRIQGSITAASLFGVATPYGRAAVLGPDGNTLYAYQCGTFDPQDPFENRPCTVARVAFASRTSQSSWRYWNGGEWTQAGSWTSNPDAAAMMSTTSGAPALPPIAAFTLTRDPAHDAYVMVYSPFPGFTDRVEVRAAVTPVGPFTDPVTVMLPGCGDRSGGVDYWCYAGTVQPSLSGSGLLG
ncbi:MAG: hypothetical protein ACK5O2_08775, partial [Microthrixaceae bacterium]